MVSYDGFCTTGLAEVQLSNALHPHTGMALPAARAQIPPLKSRISQSKVVSMRARQLFWKKSLGIAILEGVSRSKFEKTQSIYTTWCLKFIVIIELNLSERSALPAAALLRLSCRRPTDFFRIGFCLGGEPDPEMDENGTTKTQTKYSDAVIELTFHTAIQSILLERQCPSQII